MILETDRLILRPWRNEDRAPFADIVGDPHVRRYFLFTQGPRQADESIDRAMQALRENGFHFLATELKTNGRFIGLIGIGRIPDDVRAVLTGKSAVEIGWQLAKDCWGQGYAPEGARASLDYAFKTLKLPEIVAYTYRGNLPSRRVMEKLGMTHDPAEDFEHPAVPEGHPLRPHVLYRIENPNG